MEDSRKKRGWHQVCESLWRCYSTKNHVQAVSELIVQERKQIFKDLVKGGMETQTSSVADKYLRDIYTYIYDICIG
jgi:hypothetical protein